MTTSGTTVNGGTGDNINMTSGGSVVSNGVLITPTIVQCLYFSGKHFPVEPRYPLRNPPTKAFDVSSFV